MIARVVGSLGAYLTYAATRLPDTGRALVLMGTLRGLACLFARGRCAGPGWGHGIRPPGAAAGAACSPVLSSARLPLLEKQPPDERVGQPMRRPGTSPRPSSRAAHVAFSRTDGIKDRQQPRRKPSNEPVVGAITRTQIDPRRTKRKARCAHSTTPYKEHNPKKAVVCRLEPGAILLIERVAEQAGEAKRQVVKQVLGRARSSLRGVTIATA